MHELAEQLLLMARDLGAAPAAKHFKNSPGPLHCCPIPVQLLKDALLLSPAVPGQRHRWHKCMHAWRSASHALTGSVLTGASLWTAHVGDSRAVMARGGSALRLTEDHKPVPGGLERQRVEEAGGTVEFQQCWRVICPARGLRPASGLAVSRALGDIHFKEPVRCRPCAALPSPLAWQAWTGARTSSNMLRAAPASQCLAWRSCCRASWQGSIHLLL